MAKSRENNWGLKALSLIFAIMLWFYAGAEQNPSMDKSFDVNITYQDLPEGFVIMEAPNTVRVTVRGRQNAVMSLRADDFSAVVDLRDVEAGSNDRVIQLTAPETVERYTSASTRIKVVVEQTLAHRVKVAPNIIGNLGSGLELVSTTVEPDTVGISGYSSVIENISALKTEQVDLSGVTASTDIKASLLIPEGVQLNGSRTVTIHLEVKVAEKAMEVTVPIEMINVPEDLAAALSTEQAVITLKGSDAQLADPELPRRLQLYVDCANLEEGSHTLQLQLNNQSGLTANLVTPASVTVELIAIAENGNQDNTNSETNKNINDSSTEDTPIEP